jgi:hypothetical protein
MSTAIHELINLGLKIFPLEPGKKSPHHMWPSWKDSPGLTADQADNFTDFAMQIPTDMVVVDIDIPEQMPAGLTPTTGQKTTKGIHDLYTYTGDHAALQVKWVWGDMLAGGQNRYIKLHNPQELLGSWESRSPLPDFLITGHHSQPKVTGVSTPQGRKEGNRNAHLTSIAGGLRNSGIVPDEWLKLLRGYEQTHTDPLPDQEIINLRNQMDKWEGEDPQLPPEPPKTAYRTFTMADLLHDEPKIPPMLGPGLQAGTAVLFSGFTGHGKSLFVLDWVRRCFGYKLKRVAIIDNEMEDWELYQRSFKDHSKCIHYFKFAHKNDFMGHDWTGFDLVVLDTKRGGYMAKAEENVAEHWDRLALWVKSQKEKGIAVIVVAHSGKVGAKWRGNAAAGEMFSYAYEITKEEEETTGLVIPATTYTIVQGKGRAPQESTIVGAYTFNGDVFESVENML